MPSASVTGVYFNPPFESSDSYSFKLMRKELIWFILQPMGKVGRNIIISLKYKANQDSQVAITHDKDGMTLNILINSWGINISCDFYILVICYPSRSDQNLCDWLPYTLDPGNGCPDTCDCAKKVSTYAVDMAKLLVVTGRAVACRQMAYFGDLAQSECIKHNITSSALFCGWSSSDILS